MLMERIVGAFTFKKEVYAEVENDTSFTQSAWIIVTVVSFLSQLPHLTSRETLLKGFIAWVLMTLFTIASFALAAYLTSYLGETLFDAETNFEEMVRVMGLAYVWYVVIVLAALSSLGLALGGLTIFPLLIGSIMGLASWIVAVQESLDLGTGETIVTVLVGWVATFIVAAVALSLLGMLGLSAQYAGLY